MAIYEVIIAKEQKKRNRFSFKIDKDGQGEGDSESRIQQEQILLGPTTLSAKNKYSALMKALNGFSSDIDPDEMSITIRTFNGY